MEKQVTYWRTSAEEDWAVASELYQSGRIRHCLFFAHLAVEKTLKAHICRVTGNPAPPIHNLSRLLSLSGIDLLDEQIDILAQINQFNIEGRYPDIQLPSMTREEAGHYLNAIEKVLECLNKLF